MPNFSSILARPATGVLLLLTLLAAGGLTAQAFNQSERRAPAYLTSDRTVDWQPAMAEGPPVFPVVHTVVDFGAHGNGVANDAAAFQAAIDAVPASGGTVLVPAGHYLLEQHLELESRVVLRGVGTSSRLVFDLAGRDEDPIEILRYDRGEWTGVPAGAAKGARQVTVADASSFTVPGWAEIEQENDPEIMYTDPRWDVSWADGSVGEVVWVTARSGNSLTLRDPLHFPYEPSLNPRIRPQGLIEEVGLEHLSINRLDDGDGETVRVRNAANIWFIGIETSSTVRAHISTQVTYGCLVRDSYLHHSHDYGSGGHGYGVELGRHTTDCLVENNVFESLRHAMLVQVGASGNVFGYNYSRETVSGESWSPPDISVHGHYAAFNLFEGNVVQEAHIADYWGPAGPGNTLLRNCFEGEGLDVSDQSHRQNLIANDLVGAGEEIEIEAGVEDTIEHGNYTSAGTTWQSGLPQEIPDSLYLESRPAFYGNKPWPAPLDSRPALCSNPAKERWQTGEPVGPHLFADGFESGDVSFWK